MNDEALELLHRVFVECKEDEAGKYAPVSYTHLTLPTNREV